MDGLRSKNDKSCSIPHLHLCRLSPVQPVSTNAMAATGQIHRLDRPVRTDRMVCNGSGRLVLVVALPKDDMIAPLKALVWMPILDNVE
jgi:hypothetical protein